MAAEFHIAHPAVTRYLESLAAVDDEPVLLEMEALAKEKGFPIVGRLCGRLIEMLARSVGASRVFELGSGFGYSGYWFSRATGDDGEIHLTDGDPENETKAMDFLTRAGLAKPITYHVGDALTSLEQVDGEFDVVYCDIDKHGYPDAWRKGKERVRVGGYYICDNMLWSGRVTDEANIPDVAPGWTEAIMETNRMVAEDPNFRDTIVPLRDGVLAALRIQ
ncbi:MAG: caffeoyl-CoA O-methyltransferase [Actinomycetota bacterium]|jgi:predicted O-methyltransferase YrrM|nr:caffeoyl-CoA O-methyltransferase [Actinomycetota bacterium]